MVKRKNIDGAEEELLRRLEAEHELFYYRMISSPSKEVYEQCGKIRFMEVVFEYFLYCENIEPKYVQSCILERDVLSALYDVYLKYENLRVDTWEDIEQLLDRHLEIMDGRMVEAYHQFGMPIISEAKGEKQDGSNNI